MKKAARKYKWEINFKAIPTKPQKRVKIDSKFKCVIHKPGPESTWTSDAL